VSIDGLIRQLERAGCGPREIGPGRWLALCPECRSSIVEIRALADGTALVACQDAHEQRLAA
jgi:hypothetical protein